MLESLREDPEYSHSDTPVSFDGRGNLIATKKGKGGGRSLIVQSHVDVVPGGDWSSAYAPEDRGDLVVGRGACDAKGQVAAIWLAMKTLAELNVELAGDMQAQIVVEEESGGNGALALIRQGYKADAALVFEPTSLQIHPANRGALWYRIVIEGKSCHMGRKHEGISAVDLAYKVIQTLYGYEKIITADSAGYHGFERYKNPVQVNIGMLHAGDWPASVPGTAVIEGGVGFLPNRSLDQVKREMREIIESIDDDWLLSHYKLEFPKLHNDAFETVYSHPAVLALDEACRASVLKSDIYGWNVSCDARLYSKVAGLPTLVFGPGSINDAHSADEKISISELASAAEALVRFVIYWCG